MSKDRTIDLGLDDDELLRPILLEKKVVLNLMDCRFWNERYSSRPYGGDFILLSAKNTIEWRLGHILKEAEIKKLLEDENRNIEINLVDYVTKK